MEWKYIHTGLIGNCTVQLIGTTHFASDIPFLDKAFKDFEPNLVLVEADDRYIKKGFMSEEYRHIAKLCKEKGIPVRGFAVDEGILLKELVDKGHPSDAMVFLIHTELVHSLQRPLTDSSKRLVEALRREEMELFDLYFENFFDELFEILIYSIPVKKKKKLMSAIEKSPKFQAYRKRLLKTLPETYKILIGTAKRKPSERDKISMIEETMKTPEEKREISKYLEDPKGVHDVFVTRKSHLFVENIRKCLKKHRQTKVQILTGVFHFDILKKELFR